MHFLHFLFLGTIWTRTLAGTKKPKEPLTGRQITAVSLPQKDNCINADVPCDSSTAWPPQNQSNGVSKAPPPYKKRTTNKEWNIYYVGAELNARSARAVLPGASNAAYQEATRIGDETHIPNYSYSFNGITFRLDGNGRASPDDPHLTPNQARHVISFIQTYFRQFCFGQYYNIKFNYSMIEEGQPDWVLVADGTLG